MYNFTQKKWLGNPIPIKQLILCCLVFVFGLSTQFFYAQDVGSSTVKANFGIDGDVYSNELQFLPNFGPNLPPAAGTADWFKKPGSGLGVIDQATPPHHPDSDPLPSGTPPNLANTPFERRQSKIAADLGDGEVIGVIANFPVVLEGGTPYLWLDGVYGRDAYVGNGGVETSYFGGGADKNSDNPIHWTIGTSGSVPQKTDIIDVYAHLRGTGPHNPMDNPGWPLDDRPFDELYAFAGASLVVTNGNKHLDFEFFREGLETAADLDNPAKLGPDGGRTAWTFDGADGSILIPGTIIVSVDYINGGNVPSIRIRVWMSETTFNTYDNTKANRPFNVDKNVAFEKGTLSGVYGYAAINPKDAGVNMWGRVNDNFASDAGSKTLGPPWGTRAGNMASPVTDYERYQFVEIAINLTAFGLDRRGMQDPCSNILGSLLVKTRSSGGGPNEGAFGSELKDFAGPYLFGFIGGPPELAVNNLSECEVGGSATFDLNDAIDEANSTPEPLTVRTFHNNGNDAESGANPIGSPESYNLTLANSPKTIWVRSLRPGSQCDTVTSFTVTVNPRDDAEFDYPSAVCIEASDPGPSNGPASAGGTWSVNNGASISQAGVLDLSTTTAGVTYTVTYTTDDASPSPCPDSHSEDILINPRDDAEFDYPSAVCIDASNPGPSNGPASAGGTWSVNNGASISQAGVLDLSTTTAGVTYTVTYTTDDASPSPCPDSHSEDILINPRDDAEFDYPSAVCIDASNPGPSNGPASAGGTWSVNNGASISQAGVLDLSTTTAGVTYTVTYTTDDASPSPCPDSHSEDILINGRDDAEFDYPSAVCIDASNPGPSNGPASAGGTWSVNNGASISQAGVLDLSTTTAGVTYTVTYTTDDASPSPCPDSHSEDILINPRDDAEFDYPSAVCIDASNPGPSNGPASAGGTWSVNNGASISQAGVLDLSTTTAGVTYTVTYTTDDASPSPCPDSHSEDILINPRDDAEFDYPSAVCIDASNPGPSNGPASAGGTWSVNNGASISQAGVLDLSTTTAGVTYTVTYTTDDASPSPCPDSHSEDILINGRDDAEFDYPVAVCIDASNPGPSNGPASAGGTWSVNNGASISQAGVLDLSTTTAGVTYTVTYTTDDASPSPCPDSHSEDILINGRDDAEFDYPSAVCIDASNPGPSNGPASAGGTWSVNNGASISQAGVLDLSTTTAGVTYTVTYTTDDASPSPCPDSHSEDILINGRDDAEFDYPVAVCIDASNPGPSNGPASAGGTWSVNNGASISQAGVLDLSTTTAGVTYTVTYTTDDASPSPCPDSHSEDILINGRDDAEFDYPVAVCIDASNPGPSNGPASAGGTWSVNNGASISQAGVLDLSTTTAGVTYTVTYTTDDASPSPCPDSHSEDILINGRDDAEFDYPSAVCIDASNPGPSNGPASAGGTWSVNNGASISQAGVLDLSTTTAGVTYTVTYTTDDASPSPCPDSHSEDILINGRDDAEFDYPSAVCIDASNPGPSNGPASAGGTWSVNNGASISQAGVLDLSTTTAGVTYTVTYTTDDASPSPCPDSHSENIVINPLPICGITGNNFICPGETTSFTASGGTSYVWKYGGNTISTSASTGNIILPGLYTVYITDGNGCESSCSETLNVGGTNARPNVTPTDYCENDPQKPTTLCAYANVNGVPNATIEWIGAIKDGQPYVIQYDQGTGCPLAPTAVGSYQFIVEIKTNDNCVTSFGASTDFNVYPKPTVDAGLSPEALCSQGGSVQLTGSPLGGTWSGSPYITAGGLFTIPNGGISSGNYEVTYTYTSPQEDGGCSDSDTVDVPVVDCTECGTAFGVALNANKTAIDELVLDGDGKYVSGTSKCFREDSFRRWGWTNAITPSANPYILDLYRGAGRCLIDKAEYVGYVTVNYGLDNIITVEFTPKDANTGFDEIHLYVGCDPYPKLKNGAYTVAPGQYTFTAEGQGFAEGWSTSTDANKKITVPGGGLVYVIAHTVACTDTSEDVAPNGFVPREGYGEFQGNAPTPGEMNCEVVVDPWSKISVTKVTTYPVPFTDQVNVSYKFEYETDVKINVYDMKGALIKQAEDVNYVKGTYGTSTIDLSRANDQMYFIRLTTSKESAVRKVISAKPQK